MEEVEPCSRPAFLLLYCSKFHGSKFHCSRAARGWREEPADSDVNNAASAVDSARLADC